MASPSRRRIVGHQEGEKCDIHPLSVFSQSVPEAHAACLWCGLAYPKVISAFLLATSCRRAVGVSNRSILTWSISGARCRAAAYRGFSRLTARVAVIFSGLVSVTLAEVVGSGIGDVLQRGTFAPHVCFVPAWCSCFTASNALSRWHLMTSFLPRKGPVAALQGLCNGGSSDDEMDFGESCPMFLASAADKVVMLNWYIHGEHCAVLLQWHKAKELPRCQASTLKSRVTAGREDRQFRLCRRAHRHHARR